MKFLVVGIKINNFYKNISIAQNQRFLETFLIFISKQTIYLSIPTYIFPYSKSKYFFEFSIHSCRLKIRQNIFTKKMCIVVYTTKTIQKRWSTNYRYFSSITYIQRLKEARLPSMRLHVIFLMKCSHQAALLEIHAGSTSKTSEFPKLTKLIRIF